MKNDTDLRAILERIDRRSYPAYKDTAGSYRFKNYFLSIDHVQGDPFASPSHLTVTVPGEKAAIPPEYLEESHRRVALQDFLCRRFHREAEKYSHKARGSGKSGVISTCAPGQEVVERSACRINPKTGSISYRLEMGFPANGRTVNSRELEKMIFDFLPECVDEALLCQKKAASAIREVIELSDDQTAIRGQLKRLSLTAFVADGAVLPRLSGISQAPMKGAKIFKSPESLKVTLKVPHRGEITGMGIPCGITLIVGGGYHGKSTLLQALERGVYNHIAGDGREFVLTEPTAMKIRSEDGRSVHCVDISPFIRDLPDGRDTTSFSTEDASGSTSQAANVAEAVEAGSKLLLIDEDTCATNFMIRDELMQKVINKDQEPITPFIERIRPMYEQLGISTILVAGSFGAYFDAADTVIQMDRYEPVNITAMAKEAASDYPGVKSLNDPLEMMGQTDRKIQPVRNMGRDGRIKTKTLGRDGFVIDRENVELRYVEQIIDGGQSAALCRALLYAMRHIIDGKKNIREIADALTEMLETEGPGALCDGPYEYTGLTAPRKTEIHACFNRCRFLNFS